MSHEELLKRQKDILERVLQILKSHKNVLGIITTGSYARGEEDGFSDIDLTCYFNTEERIGREELFNQVTNIAPTLSTLYLYDKNALFLFENGVRLDLDFSKPSEIATEDKTKAKIIYDPQGALEKDLEVQFVKEKPSPTKWNDREGRLIDWFFWMFRQVYCWAKRGQQGDKRSFDKLNGSVQSLNQIRNKLLDMRLWTLGEKGYLKELDPEFASRLAATYPIFDGNAILNATRLLLEEYKKIIPSYYQKAAIPYPDKKVTAIERIFEELDKVS